MGKWNIEVHACEIPQDASMFFTPAGMVIGQDGSTPWAAFHNISDEGFGRPDSEKESFLDDYRMLHALGGTSENKEEEIFPFLRIYNAQVHKKGWHKWFYTGELYVDKKKVDSIRERCRQSR